MPELLSQRKAAESLGMALSTLQHHIKRGNVSAIDGKIDLSVARVQLAKYVDPDQQLRALGGRAMVRADTPTDPLPHDAPPDLIAEKARRERTLADLAEIELAEKRGELVRKADYEKALAAKLIALREQLMALPERVVALIRAQDTDHGARELLAGEILRMLSDISTDSTGAEK